MSYSSDVTIVLAKYGFMGPSVLRVSFSDSERGMLPQKTELRYQRPADGQYPVLNFTIIEYLRGVIDYEMVSSPSRGAYYRLSFSDRKWDPSDVDGFLKNYMEETRDFP